MKIGYLNKYLIYILAYAFICDTTVFPSGSFRRGFLHDNERKDSSSVRSFFGSNDSEPSRNFNIGR